LHDEQILIDNRLFFVRNGSMEKSISKQIKIWKKRLDSVTDIKQDLYEHPTMSVRKINLLRKVRVHPQHLNRHLQSHITRKLKRDLEGTWSEKNGYVEHVQVERISSCGRASSSTGFAEFDVDCQATAHKPLSGEVLDAVVTCATNMGIHLCAGPLSMFLHEKMLPPSFTYNENGSTGTYVCQKTGSIIKTAQSHKVKIVGSSWTDGQYVSIVEFA